jgi:hypothetical protein
MSIALKNSAAAIRAAINGKPANGYAQIRLDDVGRVIGAIPEAPRNAAEWINELAIGVGNNPKGTVALQTAGHLAELLEVFDATRPESAVKAGKPAVKAGEPETGTGGR